MSTILKERLCAEVDHDIVVFVIGMRINRLWKVWKWVPVMLEMPPMIREQLTRPEIGLLSSRLTFGLRNIGVLQHWRSAADLQNYAHRPAGAHLEAWKRFNAKVGVSGDVGIWHETYVVPARSLESVFVNMPAYGLGVAGRLFPAKGGRASAKKRLAGAHHQPDLSPGQVPEGAAAQAASPSGVEVGVGAF